MVEIKYVHEENTHHLGDPQIIVPLIIDWIKPQSVIDVGCGLGTFLHVFAQNGVNDLLGLDGSWVNKTLLEKNLPIDKFLEVDLEKGFRLDRKFDLAICLEVAEHLGEEYAENFIKALTIASDCILFSAGIPGQFGQNHVNEKWPDYWQNFFVKFNFDMLDIIRPVIWGNKNLARWYKQNIFLVIRKGTYEHLKTYKSFSDKQMLAIVHPEYFNLRVSEIHQLINSNIELRVELSKIKTGKANVMLYVKLVVKKILNLFKK